jgi:hypothetical protein
MNRTSSYTYVKRQCSSGESFAIRTGYLLWAVITRKKRKEKKNYPERKEKE